MKDGTMRMIASESCTNRDCDEDDDDDNNKVKVSLCFFFNWAQRNEGVLGEWR
jgi:hypothetical protein